MSWLSTSLYNLLQVPAGLALLPLALINPRRRAQAPARLGLKLPRLAPGGLWIHALSLGEVISARPLLEELRRAWPDQRLWLSAATATGLAQAREEAAKGRVEAAFYAPWDLWPSVARYLDRLRPRGLIIVETDVWPNLLAACRRRSVPAALVNFRISVARDRSHRLCPWFFRETLGVFKAVALPTELDLERWQRLGLDGLPAEVTGSLKYDQPLPEPVSPEEVGLAAGRPVVAAGSTHPGEEEPILKAFLEVRSRCPDLALILAPRDPGRGEEVAGLVRAGGFGLARLSKGEKLTGDRSVLLVDLLGRLASLYSLSLAAFVGGSLVPKGGHNVLEPAALGVPVLFGSHMDNFHAEADRLREAGAGLLVSGQEDLARTWSRLLDDPRAAREMGRRGKEVFLSHRGAAGRVVALVAGAFGW